MLDICHNIIPTESGEDEDEGDLSSNEDADSASGCGSQPLDKSLG